MLRPRIIFIALNSENKNILLNKIKKILICLLKKTSSLLQSKYTYHSISNLYNYKFSGLDLQFIRTKTE